MRKGDPQLGGDSGGAADISEVWKHVQTLDTSSGSTAAGSSSVASSGSGSSSGSASEALIPAEIRKHLMEALKLAKASKEFARKERAQKYHLKETKITGDVTQGAQRDRSAGSFASAAAARRRAERWAVRKELHEKRAKAKAVKAAAKAKARAARA
eukprot:CAMPEP_0114543108 /NCGR_PEP_ID=MMETSP0114-20121206/2183_1 /TAXON_ID=31324 /ORGANISM="Goniomonas sp, Strain m" /LENGTH=155 /DNA_ID=CAMNT_0001727431 /DNA_START=103 /DNA_END=567 /DNA_ORIENTATION=-